jgi:lipoprotein signal peptidase
MRNLRFAWNKYYPWYFLADVCVCITLLGVVLRWILK